ncbi:MAG: class I SAM-dependent methyltransferase [Rhodocyclales bacterium]|nr:class I SAM-dependent methyltransferase [Rhodocyclales bacterium]
MLPQLARPIALQGASVIITLSLAWPYYGLHGRPLPWLATSLVIGGIALLLAMSMRYTWPARLLHAALMPTIWLLQELALEWALLLIPIISLLVYRFALSRQKPLTPADQQAIKTLHELIGERPWGEVLAVGDGVSSLFTPLTQHLPEHQFTVIEQDRQQALIQRLLNFGCANLTWLNSTCDDLELAHYDVLYVALDPSALVRFADKARQTLSPEKLLISRNHALPGLVPLRITELAGDEEQALYCYRVRR